MGVFEIKKRRNYRTLAFTARVAAVSLALVYIYFINTFGSLQITNLSVIIQDPWVLSKKNSIIFRFLYNFFFALKSSETYAKKNSYIRLFWEGGGVCRSLTRNNPRFVSSKVWKMWYNNYSLYFIKFVWYILQGLVFINIWK